MFFRRAAIGLIAIFAGLGFSVTAVATATTISGYWNQVALDSIRQTNSGRPTAAQTLAVMRVDSQVR